MRYRITRVEARTGYRLWIRFTDGTEGEVDLSPLVGKGVFAAWKDPEFFELVSVDPFTGTVSWPGDIDLAPDALYRDVTSVST